MKETTQQELIALGEKHQAAHPILSIFLGEISSAQASAKQHLESLVVCSGALKKGLAGDKGYRVPGDTSYLVEDAAKANSQLSRVSTGLWNLAIALDQIGVKTNY